MGRKTIASLLLMGVLAGCDSGTGTETSNATAAEGSAAANLATSAGTDKMKQQLNTAKKAGPAKTTEPTGAAK
jgi:hypothetical protein